MILMVGSSIISTDAYCRRIGAAEGHGTSTDAAEEREGVEQSRDAAQRRLDQCRQNVSEIDRGFS